MRMSPTNPCIERTTTDESYLPGRRRQPFPKAHSGFRTGPRLRRFAIPPPGQLVTRSGSFVRSRLRLAIWRRFSEQRSDLNLVVQIRYWREF
jgi:hypothetical protein